MKCFASYPKSDEGAILLEISNSFKDVEIGNNQMIVFGTPEAYVSFHDYYICINEIFESTDKQIMVDMCRGDCIRKYKGILNIPKWRPNEN